MKGTLAIVSTVFATGWLVMAFFEEDENKRDHLITRSAIWTATVFVIIT